MNLDTLTKTLSTYSEQTNTATTSIATGLRPIALILIAIFLLIELNDWKKMLESRGQSITKRLYVEIGVKYFIAVVLVLSSTLVTDFVLEITNIITNLVNKAVPLENFLYVFELGETSGIIEDIFYGLIGGIVQFIANLITIILFMLRFIELYILQAIAPIIVAFFMLDSLRATTINFFKMYLSYAMVSVLMIIVAVIFNKLVSDTTLNIFSSIVGQGPNSTALSSLTKGILYIVTMAGIVKKAKSLIGAS